MIVSKPFSQLLTNYHETDLEDLSVNGLYHNSGLSFLSIWNLVCTVALFT